jgi:hypothetical protein
MRGHVSAEIAVKSCALSHWPARWLGRGAVSADAGRRSAIATSDRLTSILAGAARLPPGLALPAAVSRIGQHGPAMRLDQRLFPWATRKTSCGHR